MQGRVKITVIATGFDRPDAKSAPVASQTPVDLQHYSAWRQEAPLAAAGGGGSRICDLTPADGRAADGRRGQGPRAAAATPACPMAGRGRTGAALDVPAFLRRQDG